MKKTVLFSAGVWVAALGYFVDIYDLLLFSIVRETSLADLGYSATQREAYGLLLINIQMFGMLIGGILWGIMGDKKGRLSVLFGSILLYSLANLLNGIAHDIYSYAFYRFIAGVGLAGELGAGITLVAESLPKEKRGWGTMIVATIGVSGAVFANLSFKLIGDWRMCYFLGGGLGMMLLLLRIGVLESGLYKEVEKSNIRRGDFLQLFKKKDTLLKYLRCILIGLPTWFVIGILVTFSPEFARPEHLNIQGKIVGGDAIMYAYMGITLGDFLCGLASQYLQSRKKALYLFMGITVIGILGFFGSAGASATQLYTFIFLMGFGTGFWAIVVTNAAEQFGTNIRATVATTVPNFIRGALPLITLLYAFLQQYMSKIESVQLVAVIIILLPLLAIYYSEETFAKDLNYTETL